MEKGSRGRVQETGNDNKEPARAKNAAYRILAYSPRSRAEVEAKLLEKGFADAVVGPVLSDLERLGFVDDRRFAGQWAAARVRLRGFGRRRIERELRDKGVAAEIIAEILDEVFSEDSELETARLAARKKLSALRTVDLETRRRRLAGFLERKGFPFDIIRVVLKEADDAEE